MSIAYWCVLVAAVLPYATVGIAKTRGGYDNAKPREVVYEGLAARAQAAHQNGFEAFPFFAVAVLVASGASTAASIPVLDMLALLWVAMRFVYTGLYLSEWASARSMIWLAGFGVATAIFTMPVWRG